MYFFFNELERNTPNSESSCLCGKEKNSRKGGEKGKFCFFLYFILKKKMTGNKYNMGNWT